MLFKWEGKYVRGGGFWEKFFNLRRDIGGGGFFCVFGC